MNQMWIAERTLIASGNEVVQARVSWPRRIAELEWQTDFEVSGPGGFSASAIGVDGLQSLQNALEGLRVTIRRRLGPVRWDDGGCAGDGILRVIPGFFGPEFEARMSGLLDRELERHGQAGQDR